jgi:hypothetical protein
MALEYDLFIRQIGENLELRKIDRIKGETDEEYRQTAIQTGKEIKEQLGNLGIQNDVILINIDAPSEEELQASRVGPWYTLDEVLSSPFPDQY